MVQESDAPELRAINDRLAAHHAASRCSSNGASTNSDGGGSSSAGDEVQATGRSLAAEEVQQLERTRDDVTAEWSRATALLKQAAVLRAQIGSLQEENSRTCDKGEYERTGFISSVELVSAGQTRT
jgi:hypothetical protein